MSGKQASAKDIAQKVLSKARGAGQAVGAAAKDIGRGAMRGAKNIGGGGSASVSETVGAAAGRGARSVAQAAKKHPYAAAGIGAGAAGAGVLGAAALKKDEKTAAEIAEAVLRKVAFSVTEKGHAFDADIAGAKRKAFTEMARRMQEEGALAHGTSGGKTESNFPFLKGMRFGVGGYHPVAAARRQAYIEKKHREGKNAWNPFGGAFTPIPEEMEGTKGGWTYRGLGKLKPEEVPTQEATSKAASAIADAVLAKFSTL